MAFESNYLDIVMIGGDQVAVAREDVSLKDKLKITISGILHFLTFSQTKKNAQGGMLANANLRLAISNAIDREALVKNYVDDGSEATYTAVPPHYALSATTGEDFSADQAMFSEWVGYDPKRAQEFFEHAKAELKTDAFEFTLIYSNNEGDEIEKVAQAIKEQVEHHLVGLTLNLQGMTKSERVAKLMSGDFDVALTRWAPDYADPMTFLGMWARRRT